MRKVRTRVFSILLTCAMLLSLLPITALADGPDVWDGTTVDTSWYTDADTGATEFTIDSAAGLAGLAQLVNEGNNFSKKTIKLGADIDLAGKEWTPIGKSGKPFQGIFDGAKSDGSGNYTISNLYINKEFANIAANNCIGLFGCTNAPATIKNVNFVNVDIQGSLYVGTVVGYGFTGSEISNCHVSGKIEIDGWWYIGGIGGNGYVSKVTDCSVTGSAGSYIKSNVNGDLGSYVGGIWGFRGEDPTTISNCIVENVAISGMDRVGGISGIAHYGTTIQNCTIANSTITTENNIGNTGLIAGADLSSGTNIAKILDCTVINTTATSDGVSITTKIGSADHNGNPPQAQATVGSGVTFDRTGKVTGGLLEQVDDSMIADGLEKGEPAADGTFELVPTTGSTAVAKVGRNYYTSLTDAFAALNETNYSLTLLKEDAWTESGSIYWQAGTSSGYAASLKAAIEAASAAGDGIKLVCKPNANDITDSPAHINVTKDITIYANGAEFGGDDLSIGTYSAPANTSTTVNIYCAKNLVVWGQPVDDRADVWNVNFVDCENDGYNMLMYRGNESGKAQINLTLTNCKASGYSDSTIHTSADGSIKITECTFTNNVAPVNIAHKQAGMMEVVIEDSTFTGCGSTSTVNDLNQYAAPIRFVNNGTGTLTAVVDTVTITDTVGVNGDILLGDGRTGKTSTLVSATITGTNATVQVQHPGDWDNGTLNENVTKTEVTASSGGTFSNAVAKIGNREYMSIADAISAASNNDTIRILQDIQLTSTISAKKILTFEGVTKSDGTKPVISNSNGGIISQSGEAVYTLKNLELQAAADGQWYVYHSANTLTIENCDFTMADGVTNTGNVVMGEGNPATDADYALIFRNNTITANSRAALTGVGNGSQITGNTIDLIDEHWKGDSTSRTSMIAVTAKAGGAGVTITGNTFKNANRAVAVDNSTLEAGKITIRNNKFINVRYAFELSPEENKDCGTYDLNENYFEFNGTVSEPKIENADASGSHFAYGDGSNEYRPAGTSQVQNNEYYLDPSMDPEDLNTYVPPYVPDQGGTSAPIGDYLVNVDRTTGGKVTVNPGRADKGDTVTITVKPDSGYVLDELTVTAKDGGSVKLTWKDDNKYTFTMPGSQVSIEASFVKEGSEQPVVTLPFTDVTANDWYYDAVQYVYENDLMNGTSATAFSPFVTTSRAMILTILARYDGVDTSAGSTWYEAGAVWAIAKGVSDGTNLEANLTREQLVTMLWRYLGSPVVESDLSGYPDSASVSDWAVNAMIWAVKNGVITGNGAGALNPQGTATRAEVATILMRFIEN